MTLDRVIAVRTAKTVYRDGDLCIKVFNEEFSKADVLNEALNQARIEETGLNIPKIHEVTKIDGKWAIVSDFIKGKTLQQLMDEEPEKKDEYLNLFVDLQLTVLSKTSPLLNKLKDKTRYATVTSTRPTSSSPRTAHPISSTGRMRRRATARLTRREPICCSASRATPKQPSSISICSAKRATPPNSMSRSGCPS